MYYTNESTDIEPKKIFWILLCLVLLLGAFLRFYGLTHQSLWLDEANGIRIAEKGFGEIITELKSDVSPPLHYFLLHIWMNVFGTGELSVRTFAAIFGFLLIPAIYYVGSSLFSRKVGLISAFIASIGEFHVRYSQGVRMYSMLALLGLLSMYFLYSALTTDKKASWVGYIIFTILTIYTHNYGLFIATSGVVFSIIYLITQKKKPWRLLIALGIIAIAYLPWLPILITKHYGSSNIAGWIPYMRPYYIYRTFIWYWGFPSDVVKSHINSLIIWLGFIVFLCSFLAGIFSIKRYKNIFIPYIKANMNLILILCYFFVTLAIPMLVSIRKPIFLAGRYSISAWPAFPLILGLGLSKIKSKYILTIPLVLITFISCVSLYWYHFVWVVSYDRTIASFVDSSAKENDMIVFVPSWYDIPINYYLRTSLQHVGYPRGSTKEIAKGTELSEKKPEDLISIVRSRLGNMQGKIFLIYLPDSDWIPGIQTVRNFFDQNFKKLEETTYDGFEDSLVVTVYLMKGR